MSKATSPAKRFGTAVAALVVCVIVAAFGAAPEIVQLEPAASRRHPSPPVAQFSHGAHTELQCFNCHPGLFTTPRTRAGHAEMKQGASCGACHNGQQAASFKAIGCGGCHVP